MLGNLLEVIGGTLAAAVLLGAAFAVLRVSDLRGTINDQKTEIDTLHSMLETRDLRLAEEKQARELLAGRLALVEDRARHLEEIVSGRIDFSALEGHIDQHHVEMSRRFDDTDAALHDIKDLLGARRRGEHE